MSDAAKLRGYLNVAEKASAEGKPDAAREAREFALIYAIRELAGTVAEIHAIFDERMPMQRGHS